MPCSSRPADGPALSFFTNAYTYHEGKQKTFNSVGYKYDRLTLISFETPIKRVEIKKYSLIINGLASLPDSYQ